MPFKQSVVAAPTDAASLVLALPAANVVDLSVRDEEYGVGYKRSPVETFVCKRDDKYAQLHVCSTLLPCSCTNCSPPNSQSLSCLRKKSETVDQSDTANV